MTIKIGGTSDNTYQNLMINNSETNVQGTNNQGKNTIQSANNSSVATDNQIANTYVSSDGDTVEISKLGVQALQSANTNTSKASSIYDNNKSASSSNVNPASLSTPQLKQAYANGQISAAQYEQQMSSRGQAK